MQTNLTSYEVQGTRALSESAIRALIDLGQALERVGYTFTALAPAVHQRINERAIETQRGVARDLRDVFGWSRPFMPDALPRHIMDLLCASQQIEFKGGLVRSAVRFSSLDGRLIAHSAFPKRDRDAVNFGPDSYRFCALIQRWAPPLVRCLVDVNSGTAAGAITYGSRASRRFAVDSSPTACAFARVNAELASTPLNVMRCTRLDALDCTPDLIVANLSCCRASSSAQHQPTSAEQLVRDALKRLPSRGELILYARAPVVDGVDMLLAKINPLLRTHGTDAGKAFCVTYEEIERDVFGERTTDATYAEIDRVAAVGLHLRMA